MSIKEILGFTLIKTDRFTLSIYHLLVMLLILFSVWLILRIIRKIFREQEKRKRIEIGTGHAIYLIIKYF